MKYKIFVTGQQGMVGSAVCNELKKKKISYIKCSRKELDITNYAKVEKWFKKHKPNVVINCAGRVGGILENSLKQELFLNDNLLIGFNLINLSLKCGVKQFINLGSACIYPKMTKMPIKEEYLLSSDLEKTNEGYAIAKIATLKYCEYLFNKGKNFVSLQPSNLYGINDNYDLQSSHVIPALVRKFHDAKVKNLKNVKVWGDGSVTRDFVHSGDLASLIVSLIGKKIKYSFVNVGSKKEIKIKKLINIIKKITKFQGNIVYQRSMPSGQKRRILDTSRMEKLKFHPKINLEEGLEIYYKWFKKVYVKD